MNIRCKRHTDKDEMIISRQLGKDSIVKSTGNTGKTLSEVGEVANLGHEDGIPSSLPQCGD